MDISTQEHADLVLACTRKQPSAHFAQLHAHPQRQLNCIKSMVTSGRCIDPPQDCACCYLEWNVCRLCCTTKSPGPSLPSMRSLSLLAITCATLQPAATALKACKCVHMCVCMHAGLCWCCTPAYYAHMKSCGWLACRDQACAHKGD